ncbi:MAG TPA: MOSC domain-containing protein [Gammaproteobacteria bacterium]|jgi:MOSC domain-containing protein YiiM
MTTGGEAGTVLAINVAAEQNAPQRQVESADLVAGAGIVGDRYFGRTDHPGRNVTLVEGEEIERFNREHGGRAPLDGTRRNIVTRGIRLVPLIGAEFSIGGVRLRGVEQCEPCSQLGGYLATEKLDAARVVKAFVHRAGIRAEILSSGSIRVGDPVTGD